MAQNIVFIPNNNLQRIFKTLSEAAKPLSKLDLAEIIGSTPLTVAQNLPHLVREGYASQSKGMYFITQSGRERLESDPYIQLPGKRESRRDFFNEMDWDWIKNNVICREVLQQQSDYFGQKVLQRELLPIVLVWLASMEHKLPSFPGSVEEIETDKIRLAMMLDLFEKVNKLL